MALMEEKAPSTEALTRKLVEILTDNDNDVGQLCFKEETIEKVMQELYKEIIIASPTSTTTPSNVVVQQQLQPQNESMELQVVDQQEKKTHVHQGDFDDDDEWLARVLTWPQPQLLDSTSDWFSF